MIFKSLRDKNNQRYIKAEDIDDVLLNLNQRLSLTLGLRNGKGLTYNQSAAINKEIGEIIKAVRDKGD